MSRPPRVTAVVPTWNAAGFVERTLATLDAQTWPALDILIGDDASTDHTPALLRAWAAGRPNVRLVLRETNLGWIGNTNDLMAQAEGDYLFYMPHDDLLEPTYVERLVAALEADPGAVIAFCDMRFTDTEGKTEVLVFDRLSGVRSTVRRALLMAIRPRNWWVAHRGLFRRRAFSEIGGLRANEAGQFSADYAWLMHMALIGAFVRVPETLYHKIWLRTGVSKTWKGGANPGGVLYGAGLQEVRRSRLPRRQKWPLLAALEILRPVRWLRWKTLETLRILRSQKAAVSRESPRS